MVMNCHFFKRQRECKGRQVLGARRLATFAAATGLLFGAGVGAAQAATAYGTVGTVNAGGRSYSTQSVFVSDAPAYAATNQWTGSAVGAGWMGTNARTFYGADILCRDGGYYFNSGSTTFMGSAPIHNLRCPLRLLFLGRDRALEWQWVRVLVHVQVSEPFRIIGGEMKRKTVLLSISAAAVAAAVGWSATTAVAVALAPEQQVPAGPNADVGMDSRMVRQPTPQLPGRSRI